jgi:hypothetical protein
MLSFSPDVRITRTGEVGFSQSGCDEPRDQMRSPRAELPAFVGVRTRRVGSVAATRRRFLPTGRSVRFAAAWSSRHASE